jgi:Tfp pilus assembly protein PilO
MIIIIIPVSIIVWYAFLLGPQLRTEAALEAEQLSFQGSIAALDERLRSAKSIAGDLRQIEARWNRFVENTASPDNVELILAHFRETAKRNGIKVLNADLSFDPLLKKLSTKEARSQLNKIRMKIEGRGRFIDIGDFIDSLENDMIVAGIDELKLKYQSASDPEIYFRVEADIYVLEGEGDLL